MDTEQYQLEASATKSELLYGPHEWPRQTHVKDGLQANKDILHAVMGVASEGGELVGPVKAQMFYNRPLDLVNIDEEFGDILWYIAIYCTARGKKISDLMAQNNAKLKARFPNKFTEFDANNRDLFNERKILEGGKNGQS